LYFAAELRLLQLLPAEMGAGVIASQRYANYAPPTDCSSPASFLIRHQLPSTPIKPPHVCRMRYPAHITEARNALFSPLASWAGGVSPGVSALKECPLAKAIYICQPPRVLPNLATYMRDGHHQTRRSS